MTPEAVTQGAIAAFFAYVMVLAGFRCRSGAWRRTSSLA
jgi:hypothetical protein